MKRYGSMIGVKPEKLEEYKITCGRMARSAGDDPEV